MNHLRYLAIYLKGARSLSRFFIFSRWLQMLSRTFRAMCLGMMLSSRFSYAFYISLGKIHQNNHPFHLLFLFVFELESRLDTAAFVEEPSSHVDFIDVAQIDARRVQRGIKNTIGNGLGSNLSAFQLLFWLKIYKFRKSIVAAAAALERK